MRLNFYRFFIIKATVFEIFTKANRKIVLYYCTSSIQVYQYSCLVFMVGIGIFVAYFIYFKQKLTVYQFYYLGANSIVAGKYNVINGAKGILISFQRFTPRFQYRYKDVKSYFDYALYSYFIISVIAFVRQFIQVQCCHE